MADISDWGICGGAESGGPDDGVDEVGAAVGVTAGVVALADDEAATPADRIDETGCPAE